VFDPIKVLPNAGSKFIDLDGDGRKDFVSLAGGQVSVSTAVGDGTFTARRSLVPVSVDQNIQFEIGDFDGDGKKDLFVGGFDFETNRFVQTFWWNDGHGNFPTSTQLTTSDPLQPVALLLGAYDFDGDGADDLLFHSDLVFADTGVEIMHARGRKITTQSIVVADAVRRSSGGPVAVGDFDGDGQRDALFNDGVVVWGPASPTRIDATKFDLAQPSSIPVVAAADIDSDGVPDIIGSRFTSDLFVIYGKKGSRALAAGTLTGFDTASIVNLGDVNGDGIPDVVATTPSSNVQLFLGDGRGAFTRSTDLAALDSGDGQSFLIDLDQDGALDLALGKSARLAFGDGAGHFGAPVGIDNATLIGVGQINPGGTRAAFVTSAGNVQIVTVGSDRKPVLTSAFPAVQNANYFVADVDGDGVADVIVSSGNTTNVMKKGATGWLTIPLTGLSTQVQFLAAGDLDGDGRVDLVTCDDGFCDLLLGNATGFAAARSNVFPFRIAKRIAIADVDGDGKPDVIAVQGSGPQFIVIDRNLGNGTFAPAGGVSVGATSSLIAADVDGDGRVDLVLGSGLGVEVLRNGCVLDTIRVATLPSEPVEGGQMRIVVNVGTSPAPGTVTVKEGSQTIGLKQLSFAGVLGTAVFTISNLHAGIHTFTITYDDQYSGHFEKTASIVIQSVGPRRRNVRH
jgi:hypothetical protein